MCRGQALAPGTLAHPLVCPHANAARVRIFSERLSRAQRSGCPTVLGPLFSLFLWGYKSQKLVGGFPLTLFRGDFDNVRPVGAHFPPFPPPTPPPQKTTRDKQEHLVVPWALAEASCVSQCGAPPTCRPWMCRSAAAGVWRWGWLWRGSVWVAGGFFLASQRNMGQMKVLGDTYF